MAKPYNLIESLLKGTLLYLANRRPVHRLVMQHDANILKTVLPELLVNV